MCQHPATRRAFSLLELLVVVAILVILVAILVPSLGYARESANVAACQSGLRQWGMATQGYLTNFNGFLPHEGVSGQNTLADAWYNQLPPYVNQLPYDQLYTGASDGPSGGYADNWIWYCRTKMTMGSKNSGSGKNSFHYTFNAVLNGSTSFGPDYGTLNNMHHNAVAAVPQPVATVLFFEDDDNIPCDSPNASYPARTRHFGNSLNLLFIDLHVQLLKGANVPVPTTNAAGLWTSLNPPLFWGPFPH